MGCESQAPAFDNEDLSWLDLDPLPHVAGADISKVPHSEPGESSCNPIADLEATHSVHEDQDQDDDSNNDN